MNHVDLFARLMAKMTESLAVAMSARARGQQGCFAAWGLALAVKPSFGATPPANASSTGSLLA